MTAHKRWDPAQGITRTSRGPGRSHGRGRGRPEAWVSCPPHLPDRCRSTGAVRRRGDKPGGLALAVPGVCALVANAARVLQNGPGVTPAVGSPSWRHVGSHCVWYTLGLGASASLARGLCMTRSLADPLGSRTSCGPGPRPVYPGDGWSKPGCPPPPSLSDRCRSTGASRRDGGDEPGGLALAVPGVYALVVNAAWVHQNGPGATPAVW